MRGLQDYRMIIYAIVLILVMLFTWSPRSRWGVRCRDKVSGLFRKEKKEAASNE